MHSLRYSIQGRWGKLIPILCASCLQGSSHQIGIHILGVSEYVPRNVAYECDVTLYNTWNSLAHKMVIMNKHRWHRHQQHVSKAILNITQIHSLQPASEIKYQHCRKLVGLFPSRITPVTRDIKFGDPLLRWEHEGNLTTFRTRPACHFVDANKESVVLHTV